MKSLFLRYKLKNIVYQKALKTSKKCYKLVKKIVIKYIIFFCRKHIYVDHMKFILNKVGHMNLDVIL